MVRDPLPAPTTPDMCRPMCHRSALVGLVRITYPYQGPDLARNLPLAAITNHPPPARGIDIHSTEHSTEDTAVDEYSTVEQCGTAWAGPTA